MNGTQNINDEIAKQAKLDIIDAYDDADARTSADAVTLSGNIGGLTITPGLYFSTSSLSISSGDLDNLSVSSADVEEIENLAVGDIVEFIDNYG